jgi:hypothetical protein
MARAIEGLRPSFSAHVRWGEHGAPVRFPPAFASGRVVSVYFKAYEPLRSKREIRAKFVADRLAYPGNNSELFPLKLGKLYAIFHLAYTYREKSGSILIHPLNPPV